MQMPRGVRAAHHVRELEEHGKARAPALWGIGWGQITRGFLSRHQHSNYPEHGRGHPRLSVPFFLSRSGHG